MKPFKEPLYSQSYVDTGTGFPVVLLHGIFGNLAMWRTTINALRTNYRVVVPRLPLFDVPIHRATLGNLSEILHDFLDWNQLTDVTLVGTDIGAQLALDYAFRHPERVRKVVISGSTGFKDNIPNLGEDTRTYGAVQTQVEEAFHRKEIVSRKVVDQVYNLVNTSSKGLHISAFAKSAKDNGLTNILYKLQLPVLIVWGLQDKITPPDVALHFHDLLRNGTVRFINECGHLPMIERPEEYNRHVREFLDTITKASVGGDVFSSNTPL